MLHRLEEAQKPIAAICAATTAVARSGLLKTGGSMVAYNTKQGRAFST